MDLADAGKLTPSEKKRRSARADGTPPGRGRVQLRLRTGLAGEQYVKAQGWRHATLARCPHHPGGGCSLARHGTYARKTPAGTRIARWYCPESHTTFSLLPDCLAARLPGTLANVEDAVATAEDAASVAAAAATLRAGRSEPAGAMRWLRRRIRLVTRALNAVRGLLPERFVGCAATVPAFRAPPRHRRGARLAARDRRAAAPGAADAARLRPPRRRRGEPGSAVPTTGGP